MHAYLLVGDDAGLVTEQAGTLAKKLGAKVLPFPVQKIEDVRTLERFTNLTISEPTAILIESIDEATVETLNAFLKNLEEPQKNLYYILTARREKGIIATILSRCQLIKVVGPKKQLDDSGDMEKFLKMPVGKKLAYIEKIKDREKAKEFVIRLLSCFHNLLSTEKPENLPLIARGTESGLFALKALKANGNPSLQLTNLVINLV